MRLMTRSTLGLLGVILVVFAGGAFIFYYLLGSILDEELTEELYRRRDRLLAQVEESGALPEPAWLAWNEVRMDTLHIPAGTVVMDTLMLVQEPGEEVGEEEEEEMEWIPVRKLRFPVAAGGRRAALEIHAPRIEPDDLIETIMTALLLLLAVLAVLVVTLSFLYARRVWRPFYALLAQLRQFDPAGQQALGTVKTRVQEFQELQQALTEMALRIQRDFRAMKEFTENASHELQTPLAIVQTKLELLLQSSALAPEEAALAQAAQEAAQRLSRLNQSLLLLARIEHVQFGHTVTEDFSAVCQRKAANFADLFRLRGRELRVLVTPGIRLPIPPDLADILLNNLLSNALMHSSEGSPCTLELQAGTLAVSSLGAPLPFSPALLFERFRKGGTSGSQGLGLAIVHQICATYGLQVHYNYVYPVHTFQISFAS